MELTDVLLSLFRVFRIGDGVHARTGVLSQLSESHLQRLGRQQVSQRQKAVRRVRARDGG